MRVASCHFHSKTRYKLSHERHCESEESSAGSGSRDCEEYSQVECQFHGPQLMQGPTLLKKTA
jgi:hypothetical protein